MMVKQVRLQGLIVGSRRHQQDFVRAIEATGLKPVIDRSFEQYVLKLVDAHRQKRIAEYSDQLTWFTESMRQGWKER